MNQSIGLLKAAKAALPTLAQLLSANVAMLVRNGTLMTTWALATAVATRMGTLDVAAHQVALSIWLLCALISEAPGIAAQVNIKLLLSHLRLPPWSLTMSDYLPSYDYVSTNIGIGSEILCHG